MISLAAEPARAQSTRASRIPRERRRVLIVDDHAAMRSGLERLLADQDDFDVVAAVASAKAALSVAQQQQVDVAVVDYELGGHNGLWLSRKLKRMPRPPAVLIYSAYTDEVLAAAAVVAEADGILGKGGLGAELTDAIRAVAHGRTVLPPIPPWLGDALRRRLDHEEQAIFGMLLAGIELDEIAAMLDLTAAELEARLWEMLRILEGRRADPRENRAGRTNDV